MNINITSKAVEKLKELIEKEGQALKHIRILISGIGWGGPRFGIALDEQKENDKKVQAEDLNFIIEEEIASQINTIHIDYKDFFLNKGFQVYAEGYNSSYC